MGNKTNGGHLFIQIAWQGRHNVGILINGHFLHPNLVEFHHQFFGKILDLGSQAEPSAATSGSKVLNVRFSVFLAALAMRQLCRLGYSTSCTHPHEHF